VKSLGSAAEESNALAESLRAAAGDRSHARGGREESGEGRRPPKRREPSARGAQTRSASGRKKPGSRRTKRPG
jgi:hypothetical protein